MFALGQMPLLENASSVLQVEQLGPLYNRSGNRITPTSQAFWNPHNIRCLVHRIEKEVEAQVNMPVQAVLDSFFFAKTSEIVNGTEDNLNIQAINDTIARLMVDRYVSDILRRKLYYKFYIFEDRPRIITRPQDTYGRHRIVRPSSFNYFAQDPDQRYWDAFRASQECAARRIKRPSLFDVYFQNTMPPPTVPH
uniref:Capsid protein n=1 Tax=viral metagenome TaxID=1070528 RepID=A0A6C0BMF4_9ZZZZ